MRAVGRLSVVAVPASFVWERLQAPGFTGMPPGWTAVAVCGLAAVGDGLIVVALHGLGWLVFREPGWFAPPRWGRYAALVAAGVLVNAGIEWLLVRRFALFVYSALQPVLPGLHIGVFSIVQALVMLPVVFWLTAGWMQSRA